MRNLAKVNTVLYGTPMSQKISAKDWIGAALKALARDGFTAIKADILAKSLGVSRGSFYWHFENIGAFHLAVMQRWQDIATDAIILQVERDANGANRLPLLIHLALTADSSLEIAMRAWASSYPPAIPFIESVDQLRLQYIEKLLRDAGLARALARTRAKIIYWTYLGASLSGKPQDVGVIKNLTAQLTLLALRAP